MYLYLKCNVKKGTQNTKFKVINPHINDMCHVQSLENNFYFGTPSSFDRVFTQIGKRYLLWLNFHNWLWNGFLIICPNFFVVFFYMYNSKLVNTSPLSFTNCAHFMYIVQKMCHNPNLGWWFVAHYWEGCKTTSFMRWMTRM
jgi:hypothetical protein